MYVFGELKQIEYQPNNRWILSFFVKTVTSKRLAEQTDQTFKRSYGLNKG